MNKIFIITIFFTNSVFGMSERDCDIQKLRRLTNQKIRTSQTNMKRNLRIEADNLKEHLDSKVRVYNSLLSEIEAEIPSYKMFRKLRRRLGPLQVRVNVGIGDIQNNEKELKLLKKELNKLSREINKLHPSLIQAKKIKIEIDEGQESLTKIEQELKTIQAQDTDKR